MAAQPLVIGIGVTDKGVHVQGETFRSLEASAWAVAGLVLKSFGQHEITATVLIHRGMVFENEVRAWLKANPTTQVSLATWGIKTHDVVVKWVVSN